VNLFALVALLSAACLFLAMLCLSEVGRRIGMARLGPDRAPEEHAVNQIQSSLCWYSGSPAQADLKVRLYTTQGS
jgi:hypothetical protein